MLKFTRISLVLNVLMIISTLSTNIDTPSNDADSTVDLEIQEALKFSNVVTAVIEEYIREALPLDAKPKGETILQNVQESLQYCEKLVNTTADIWQYKYCSSALLRDSMAALAALQAKYRPYSSSASRIKLFW